MPVIRLALALAALFGLCAAGPASARPPRAAEHAAACEIGRNFARASGATSPLLLQPGPFAMIDSAANAPLYGAASADKQPTADLARRWALAPASSIADACPELLRDGSARFATAEEIERTHRINGPPLTVHQLTAPIFSTDLHEALVGYGYQCPGLCAGELLYYLRKVEGRWVVAFTWPLMFS